MRAMVTKAKTSVEHARETCPGDLEPIVIQFDAGPQDVRQKQLAKLYLLADYYKIKSHDNPGWEIQLALQLASELHSGFRVVYDDSRVTLRNRRGANLPTLEGCRPRNRRPKGTGWAPELSPDFLAWRRDDPEVKNSRISDEKYCEDTAKAFDRDLAKLSQVATLKKRTATLIRRLSTGRKREKARETGSK
jgi:hypothetical protein